MGGAPAQVHRFPGIFVSVLWFLGSLIRSCKFCFLFRRRVNGSVVYKCFLDFDSSRNLVREQRLKGLFVAVVGLQDTDLGIGVADWASATNGPICAQRHAQVRGMI